MNSDRPWLPENPDQYETLEELEKAVQESMDRYNRAPQEELGGLSPDQVFRLIHARWDSSTSPIRLNQAMLPGEVNSTPILKNARILLESAQKQGGLESTQADNLRRKVVSRFLDKMEFPEGYVEDIRRMNKVINEQDVSRLHTLRVVLEAGDLLELKQSRFETTSLAEDLLATGKDVSLYVHLFQTYFQDYNIEYYTRGPETPEIQDTIGFTLYQLTRLEDRWYDKEDLVDFLLLPTIRESLEDKTQTDLTPFLVSQRVLKPLRRFNLLEHRKVGEGADHEKSDQYRKHKRVERFLSINLSG